MRVKQARIFFCILLQPLNIATVYACSPPVISMEQKVAKATAIYRGYVSGLRLVDLEKQAESGVRPDLDGRSDAVEVRVAVTRTVSGEPKEIEVLTIDNCSQLEPKLRDDVVLFRMSENYFLIESSVRASAYLESTNK